MTSHKTREIRKLNFMTDHGSIRAITRLARRGCPVAGRAGLTAADRGGLVLADRGGLAVEEPRENRAAPRSLPLRRAAPIPPTVAAAVAPTVAAAAPSPVPRSVGVASGPRPPSGPRPESPNLESPSPGPEWVSVMVAADPSGSVAGYGTMAGSLYGDAVVSA